MYFILFMTFITGISGLYLGVVGFKSYRNITVIAEKVSIIQIIKIAFAIGAASTLVFFALIFSISLFDEQYIWSLQRIIGAFLISSIGGLISTLGTMYQVYTTVIFRDLLIKKYKK